MMKAAFPLPLIAASFCGATLFAPAPAAAQVTVATNELVEVCSRTGTAWIDFCNGYMQAANDIGAELSLICIPLDTSRATLTAQFQAFAAEAIETQPQLAEASAINVVVASLNAMFPCEAANAEPAEQAEPPEQTEQAEQPDTDAEQADQ
jgi:hypothetical protein